MNRFLRLILVPSTLLILCEQVMAAQATTSASVVIAACTLPEEPGTTIDLFKAETAVGVFIYHLLLGNAAGEKILFGPDLEVHQSSDGGSLEVYFGGPAVLVQKGEKSEGTYYGPAGSGTYKLLCKASW